MKPGRASSPIASSFVLARDGLNEEARAGIEQ